ncbi:MAG: hypothetical protein KF891_04355 [Rhizobacter sp.]|nr:hypothetical protein [Rhizobacter sp.]
MTWSPEIVFAVAVGLVAFLAGLLLVRKRAKRTRSVGLKVKSGPAELRFVCASCGGRFTHSRRTLTAWENGARSFYCSACHTRSLGEGAPPKSSYVPKPQTRSGCLPVLVLLVALPVAAGAAAGVAVATLRHVVA